MTDTEEKVPFIKCLVHETKKATIPYLKFAGIFVFGIMFLIDLIYAIVTFWTPIISTLSEISYLCGSCYNVVTGIAWAIVAVIPWWGYLILLFCSPPVTVSYTHLTLPTNREV